MKIHNKKFVYLISPNKIINKSFYIILNQVFKSKKVKFFQLRLKKESVKKKVIIANKILQICKKNKVIKWSKENSIDQIEYLNGSIFQREFSQWKEKVGYDLFIHQIGKPNSFVEWRLKKKSAWNF